MPQDRFPVLWSGQVAVVRVPAEIDATIADDLREALLSVLNLGAQAVVIDMTRTSFCDSAGVSALVRARRRADACEAQLSIATQSAAVLRLFSLIGITTAIDVYPNVSAALSCVPRAARQVHGPPAVPGGSAAGGDAARPADDDGEVTAEG